MQSSKNTQILHLDIINLLENETKPISMQEIVNQLKYPTLHAVKRTVHELKFTISHLYPENKMTLIIDSRNGVSLIRHNVSLQELMLSLSKQSIPYQLIFNILEQRRIPVTQYCEEHFISHSTLIRYIKKSNELIQSHTSNTFQIVSFDYISIKSTESTVRMLFYFLLKSSSHSLEQLDEWHSSIKNTKKIFDHFALTYNETQIQRISLWFYVCQKAINNNIHVKPSDPALKNISYFFLEEKPMFLKKWQKTDWQLFCLFFYSMEFKLTEKIIRVTNTTLFHEIIEAWIKSFESVFHTLSFEEKQFTTLILQRQFQYIELTQFKESVLKAIEFSQDTVIKTEHPFFLQTTEKLWQTFYDKVNRKGAIQAFAGASLANCARLVPLSSFILHPVYIYVITETTYSHVALIQEQIKSWCHQYTLEFVSDFRKADLVITSCTFIDALEKNQKMIHIRASLTYNDLNHIQQSIYKVLLDYHLESK